MEKGNVYYSPETWGLILIDSIDFADSYEFDIYAVWKDAQGALYWAFDSGCSCPTPFEDYHSLSDLKPIRDMADFEAFRKELAGEVFDGGMVDEAHTFVDKVRNAWGEWLRGQRNK